MVGALLVDLARRLDAVHVGELDVEEDDVGPELLDQPERLAAVGGLGDDLDVLLVLEKVFDPFAEQRLVVRDDDRDFFRRRLFRLGQVIPPSCVSRASLSYIFRTPRDTLAFIAAVVL